MNSAKRFTRALPVGGDGRLARHPLRASRGPAEGSEVAANHFVEPGNRADTLKLLWLDRNLLEIYTVRGRNMTAYTKRKAELGLCARPTKKLPRQS